jgi:polygalacturonase
MPAGFLTLRLTLSLKTNITLRLKPKLTLTNAIKNDNNHLLKP